VKQLLACLLVPFVVSPAFAQKSNDVKITQGDHQLDIRIGDRPFAKFNYAHDLPKPFFLPVHAPDGTVITRALDDPKDKDHKHHKGIWLSVDEINKVQFWAEKGKIANYSVKVTKAAGNPAQFVVKNNWMGTDGPIIAETTTVSVHSNGILAYDITFTAVKDEVEFEDTKEGLFGFRMVSSMREKEGGKVVNSDGKKGTKECWGQTAAWVDYYGQVDGKTCGLAIFDHPKNFRASRYHVRNYGLFSISPFGEKAYTGGKNQAAPLHLKKGETTRLRYAMYIHMDDTDKADVAGAYKKYLKSTAE